MEDERRNGSEVWREGGTRREWGSGGRTCVELILRRVECAFLQVQQHLGEMCELLARRVGRGYRVRRGGGMEGGERECVESGVRRINHACIPEQRGVC